MGRKRQDSLTIGGKALKDFITIVSLLFQGYSSKFEQTEKTSWDREDRKNGKAIKVIGGLDRCWIKNRFLKIVKKLAKKRETHLTGT